jgi:DNA-binding transcriptional ArsR family regulator
VVRLHFTFHDLRRVRVADRPYPLIETVLALWRLQGSDAGVLFDSWRRHVRMTAMTEPPMLARLTGLAPNGGGLPSFLVPIGHSQDLDGWIDSVRSAPQARVRGDLASFARAARRPLRGWLRELADTATARRDLEESLRSFQRAAIAPVATAMAAAVEHERASRARDLLDGGLDRLFGNLPGIRWEPPTLNVPCPADLDIPLGGRGLVLVPSYFCWDLTPVIHDPDTAEAPLLSYPVRHRPLPAPGAERQPERALAAALGKTRAALLESVTQPATTGELARRLGIAPATVSWHITALRQAGLISTTRNRFALHTLTAQGRQLLERAARPSFRASSNLWTTTS